MKELNKKILFNKYPELLNGKDKTEEQKYPFVEGGYGSQTIVVETMRGLPIAMKLGMGFMMPEQAPQIQVQYLMDKFGLPLPELLLFDNEDPLSYNEIIEGLPEKSLVVLQPYDSFSKNTYLVNPDHLQFLNSKENLPLIALNTPKVLEGSIDDLVNQHGKIVIKKKGPGAAGDSVKITDDPETTIDGEYFIEEFIPAEANYGIQFFVSPSGISYVGHNYQQTTADGEFLSVTCLLDQEPPEQLLKLGYEACKNLGNYTGFVGFDALFSKGEFTFIDPNIRMTAATPAFVLKDELKELLGPVVQITSGEIKAESPERIIDMIEQYNGILLGMSHQDNGIYKVFAFFGGNTFEQAMYDTIKFKEITQ